MTSCIDWSGARGANEKRYERRTRFSTDCTIIHVIQVCNLSNPGHFVKESLKGTVHTGGDYATGNNVPSLLFDGRKWSCMWAGGGGGSNKCILAVAVCTMSRSL